MSKLLLIEDDTELVDILKVSLEAERYSVDVATDGQQASDHLRHYKYALIILDWELPKKSGIEICREFRDSGGTTPIIMLTGRHGITDKEAGFDLGCDDYLTKPFNPRELKARIRALLRRPRDLSGSVLTVGTISLDTVTRAVTRDGITVDLLPLEYRLLEFLMRHPNVAYSPEALLDRVWDSGSDSSIDAVRTVVKTLRSKIAESDGGSIVKTVHRVGYKVSD